MSFMSESTGYGRTIQGLSSWVAPIRAQKSRVIAEKGIELGLKADRRRAAMEIGLRKQRTKEQYAQAALARRMGNVALQGRPRATGSVLGGRGRR
jgi:hypothetical protein